MAPSHRFYSTTAIVAVTLCTLASRSLGGLSRVSQDSGMGGWNFASGDVMGGSFAPISVSADGRYVAFVTDAENLHIHSNSPGTVAVLHDMQTGQNTLVTPTSDGQPLNGGIDSVSVSADGHYVAFASWASNLVAGDTNGSQDVFVRDIWLGTTARVSVPDSGGEANDDSWSTARCISADGRYVTFLSRATNMTAAPDTNQDKDIFVRDLQARRTYLVSKSTAGIQSNSGSEEPNITSNGRYITYFSFSDNLVPGLTGQIPRVYVRDTDPTQNTTSLVATGVLGSTSYDGHYVVYTTLPGTVSPWGQVYVHDMTAGTDKAVSVAPDGVTLGNRDSIVAWINDSGRYVTYTSKARNLVANDTNDEADVFMRDLQTNVTTRLSVGVDGLQGNRSSGYGYPSSDGRYVAFVSASEDLVPMDFNEKPDIFITGPLFASGFQARDVAAAAAIVGGKKIATAQEMAAYNVVKTGAGANKLDISDAVRIARIAAGLDSMP
ncbi:MAG TPA: hypothetical protein VGM51_14525 [Armatimonadota bacterium]|jgi:hypothetical protein